MLKSSNWLINLLLLQIRWIGHQINKKVCPPLLLEIVLAAILELKAQHLIEVISEFIVHYVNFFTLYKSPVNIIDIKAPKFTLNLWFEQWPCIQNSNEALLPYWQSLYYAAWFVQKLKPSSKHYLKAAQNGLFAQLFSIIMLII